MEVCEAEEVCEVEAVCGAADGRSAEVDGTAGGEVGVDNPRECDFHDEEGTYGSRVHDAAEEMCGSHACGFHIHDVVGRGTWASASLLSHQTGEGYSRTTGVPGRLQLGTR